MGEWVQNVGLREAVLPGELSALAASEGFWLPEPPSDGWSWVTLEKFLGAEGDFERLVESVAVDNQVPAIGYAVFDGDCSLLVAASPEGISARLIFDPETYDLVYGDEGFTRAAVIARGGAKAFAAWASSFAPQRVSIAAVRRFCEEPDPLALLTAVGLYPTAEPDRRPAWREWHPFKIVTNQRRSLDWPQLVGAREFVILPEPAGEFEGPPGPWIMFLASRDTFGERRSMGVGAYLTFTTVDQWYLLQWEFKRIDDARRSFGPTYYGRPIGEWRPVPDDVGLGLAETIAWLLETSVEDGEWRLAWPHDDLRGATIVRQRYRGRTWWLDSCSFCSAPFVDPTISEEHARWASESGYRTEGYATESAPDKDAQWTQWICIQCFNDFHERFKWHVVTPIAPGADS